jgi:hypothetical protein
MAGLIFKKEPETPVNSVNTNTGADLEKGEATPPPRNLEQEALNKQLHFGDVQTSFFALYRYATFFDLTLVAVSTICAVIAGAVVPVAPVSQPFLPMPWPCYAIPNYYIHVVCRLSPPSFFSFFHKSRQRAATSGH